LHELLSLIQPDGTAFQHQSTSTANPHAFLIFMRGYSSRIWTDSKQAGNCPLLTTVALG